MSERKEVVESGGLGESLELKVTDSRTGKVRRHLVQVEGQWWDLADPKTEKALRDFLATFKVINEFVLGIEDAEKP